MADPATLTTPRLILRALTLADADALFPAFADRDTMRFFGDRHGSVADTRALFRHVIDGAEAHTSRQWSISAGVGRSPERLTVIGSLSVNGIVGGTAHMGFILMKEHHGRGFATEAVHAVLDHAFGALGLHRFTLRIDPENVPSQRVAQKLGFKQEGRMRESFPIDGRFRDELVFGLLEREWRAKDPDYFRNIGNGAFR
jgi:ribosomal-protein-alanine N-acetyltransferase